ncbi:MAG: acyltransferase [Sinobacteraceae bacterium]|nr:acyltransferase [Nevskiaceae bacterium]
MKRVLYRIQDWRAKRWLLGKSGVRIDTISKVAYRNIRSFKEGCQVSVGRYSIFEGWLFFDRAASTFSIGERTYIGGSAFHCAERIEIGSDVLISWGCTVMDHDSHALLWQQRKNDVTEWFHGRKSWEHIARRPVIIGDRVWIGCNCTILKGVSIGESAVVGAGSVVTKDVPAYVVVAGNPARVIQELPRDND